MSAWFPGDDRRRTVPTPGDRPTPAVPHRTAQAAAHLASSLAHLVAVAGEEGVVVPAEIRRQVLAVHAWAKGLTDPGSTRPHGPRPPKP